jgi:hypothetical protein
MNSKAIKNRFKEERKLYVNSCEIREVEMSPWLAMTMAYQTIGLC